MGVLANHRGRDQLAQDLGYQDTNYLNQVVRGHTPLGNGNAKKWAERLGLPPGWFDREIENNDEAVSDVGPKPYQRGEQEFRELYLLLGPAAFAEEIAQMAGAVSREDAIKIARYFLDLALSRNDDAGE